MSTWDSIYENYIHVLESRDHLRIIFNTMVNVDRKLKVTFAYQQLYADKYLPELDLSARKSAVASTTYRNLGDEAFARNTDVVALKYYTKSIASAPPTSEPLAAAYASRSSVLVKINRHRSSLLDINRALALPLAPDRKDELLSRKKDCVETMKLIQSDTEALLNSVSSDFSIGDQWTREALENGYKSCAVDNDGTEMDYELKFPLPPAELNNVLVSRASVKIKLDCNEKLGRHLVATDLVAPGEVVLFDEPYACVLLPEVHHSHCSNCCVRCEMLIPCPGCSTIMFCGQKCLQSALSKYHRVECEILRSAVALDLSKTALLALRILMVATEQGSTLQSLMVHPIYGDPFARRPFDPEKVYDSSLYDSVQDLIDHLDRKDTRYQLYRCCLAAVLVHLLRHSTYFDIARSQSKDEQIPGILDKYEGFAGTLLLKYLYAIECNAHAITETIERQPDTPKRSLSIGIGLYPLISIGNHTCNSNLVRLNHRNCMVFYALGQISPGEQLTDNYGIHFTTHDLQERREFIRHFQFECECEACRFNWPLYEDLPTQKKYLTETIDEQTVEVYTQLFEKWLQNPVEANVEDEFEFLCKYLTLLRHSVEQPFKTYFECQEALRQLILLRTNYYSYCADLIVD